MYLMGLLILCLWILKDSFVEKKIRLGLQYIGRRRLHDSAVGNLVPLAGRRFDAIDGRIARWIVVLTVIVVAVVETAFGRIAILIETILRW